MEIIMKTRYSNNTTSGICRKSVENQTEWPLFTQDSSYEAPAIEVVEVSIEKGFADSTTDWGDGGGW